MAYQEKPLGQVRTSGTSAVSVYSPGAGVTGIVRTIMIANVTNAAVNCWIYLDINGSVFDEHSAIFPNVSIPAYTAVQLGGFFPMDETSDLGYKTNVANALTVTAFGSEVS